MSESEIEEYLIDTKEGKSHLILRVSLLDDMVKLLITTPDRPNQKFYNMVRLSQLKEACNAFDKINSIKDALTIIKNNIEEGNIMINEENEDVIDVKFVLKIKDKTYPTFVIGLPNDNEPENNKEENKKDNKNYYKKNKFSFNKRKDNKEKNLIGKDSKKSSFAKLNELREITSKLASEVEKKIQLINKNKLISKSKSSPKLAENYTKYDYKNYKMEIEIENKNNEEISIDKDKEKKESQTENDNLLSSKSYKYNQLIKDTKIEISNLINNSQSQSTKKKKLISENILPEELKNECISELKKMKE